MFTNKGQCNIESYWFCSPVPENGHEKSGSHRWSEKTGDWLNVKRHRKTERQKDRDRERKSLNLTGSVVLCQKIAMRKVAATGGVRKLEMD